MLYCPRCFLFGEVPYYHGEPLLVAYGEEEYGFYCRWLAGYLEGVAGKEVPPCQRELCEELQRMKPGKAVFWLAEDGFRYSDWIGTLERQIEDGLSYEEAVAEFRPWWEEYGRDFEPEEVEPFEEWINPRLWQDALRELREQERMPFPVRHFDLEYRMPLASIIARESSAEKRLELIHSFYHFYDELASK